MRFIPHYTLGVGMCFLASSLGWSAVGFHDAADVTYWFGMFDLGAAVVLAIRAGEI